MSASRGKYPRASVSDESSVRRPNRTASSVSKESGRRPRILLTNHHLRRGGGHDTFIETVLDSDLTRTFDVHVSSPEGSRLVDIARRHDTPHWPCRLQIDRYRPIRLSRSLARFRTIVRRVEPDLVHANGGHDAWVAAITRWISGTNFALVRTHHATKPIEQSLANELLYTYLIDRNLYVSRAQFESVTSEPNLRPDSWEIVPNGIDLEHFTPRRPDPRHYEELGLDPGDFVVGSIAGTTSYKRVDLALEALSTLEGRESIRICVLGRESTADVLLREARRLGVSDQFIHLGFHEDVRPYAALFDVGFVLSDRIESCSIATREMMAMGIPVISSDFPGSRENIDDGRDGFIVESGSAAAVRTAIDRVRGMSDEERSDLSRRAREKAVESFGRDRQVRRLREVWNELLRIRSRI